MIDRRIRILRRGAKQTLEITTVTALRESSSYILLGEPGIGKSTVFAGESAVSSSMSVIVSKVLSNSPVAGLIVWYAMELS